MKHFLDFILSILKIASYFSWYILEKDHSNAKCVGKHLHKLKGWKRTKWFIQVWLISMTPLIIIVPTSLFACMLFRITSTKKVNRNIYINFRINIIKSNAMQTFRVLNLSDKSAICLHFSGEKPFNCHLCSKAFSESCKLKRHLSRVHYIMKNGGIWLTEDMHGLTSVQFRSNHKALQSLLLWCLRRRTTLHFLPFSTLKCIGIFPIFTPSRSMTLEWMTIGLKIFMKKYCVFHAQMIKSMKMCITTWRFIKHVKAIVFEYLSKVNCWNTK